MSLDIPQPCIKPKEQRHTSIANTLGQTGILLQDLMKSQSRKIQD